MATGQEGATAEYAFFNISVICLKLALELVLSRQNTLLLNQACILSSWCLTNKARY